MKKRFLLILLLFLVGFPNGIGAETERSWQDESIYYITIDRFNNSDFSIDFDVDANDPNKYHGGDFQGVIDRLDYIKDMGFTTINLSPIFDNDENGYHGYWVKDYFNTEENFGSVDTFKNLVNEAHKIDMKVIIDFFIIEPTDKILDAAMWWIEETDIDGYRLDSEEQIPEDFLEEFSQVTNREKDNFLLLGEQKGTDGFFDYSLSKELRGAFAKPDQSLEPVTKLTELNTNPIFLDNQHTYRFTRDMVNNNEHPGPRWKLALTYLYTAPGMPFVFYGSEIALDGGEEPDNQRQMDFRTDKELVDYITSVAKLRQEHPSLRRGNFEVLHEENGMIVYKREYEGETSVIALNNTTKSRSAEISLEDIENKELRGLLTGDLVPSEDGKYNIILDRDEAEVYMLADKSGLNIPFIAVTVSVIALFIAFLFILKKKGRK